MGWASVIEKGRREIDARRESQGERARGEAWLAMCEAAAEAFEGVEIALPLVPPPEFVSYLSAWEWVQPLPDHPDGKIVVKFVRGRPGSGAVWIAEPHQSDYGPCRFAIPQPEAVYDRAADRLDVRVAPRSSWKYARTLPEAAALAVDAAEAWAIERERESLYRRHREAAKGGAA